MWRMWRFSDNFLPAGRQFLFSYRFVNIAGDLQEPGSPDDECGCGHPWWQHSMLESNVFSNSRGGSDACGGFYPVCIWTFLGILFTDLSQRNDMEEFNQNMICMCSRPWLIHRAFLLVYDLVH